MTFRQVVFQHLWSFQLSLFRPGTERNMEDLENTREAQSEFIVNSSDERFISSLAEVVSYCALENAKSKCIQEAGGLHSKSTFHWFQKPQKTTSNDSSISICRISDSEVAKEARRQIETYKLMKGRYANRMKKMKYAWWVLPDCARLDLIGGSEFGSWTCEFIPTYRLQIQTTTFKDVKLEGCHKLADNRWEVLLTHNQMVELANILDMYYEDRYTLPDKKLLLFTETPVTLKTKSTQWKLLFAMFAGGCAIMILGILAQFSWPRHARKVAEVKHTNSLSEVNFSDAYSLESNVVESLCNGIIKRIKDELGWPGDVMVDKDIGVWTGTLPSYLRNPNLVEDAISGEVRPNFRVPGSENHEELSTHAGNPLAAADLELQKTSSDIASYQAVLTRDGKLIGFQPTSRAAVNHWSSNPMAKSLYGAKKLSPGLLEPRLNIPPPRDPIPIELLMSVKPESRFALARPIQQ
ncbi:hypothetical protein KSP39_PZI024190 [Platanthera zijinensis]|uniref:Uncharacterized protein n=1 Tax=Platanthera zijinensis TaxID=2320716 RepID=A0AAP0ATW8_9ASPA